MCCEVSYMYLYICKGARMCAHYGARKPARALGCEKVRTLVYEDVRTFEREEVRTSWCVYARKPILYIKLVSLNFRTITPLNCKILMKSL